MRCRLCIAGIMLVGFVAAAIGAEKLDRGLVALEREDGSVFVSWRLLESDPADSVFWLRRFGTQSADRDAELIADRTCFVDKAPPSGWAVYSLYTRRASDTPGVYPAIGTVAVKPSGKPKAYISIPLDGDYDFQKIGFGDLDGDGMFEYVIKQPNFNTDPYQQPGYWKKSNSGNSGCRPAGDCCTARDILRIQESSAPGNMSA